MRLFYLILSLVFHMVCLAEIVTEITPYKYTDKDREKGYPVYQIPQSSEKYSCSHSY